MTTPDLPFDSLYTHGFARVAAAVPRMRVTDVEGNVARTVELAQAGRRRRRGPGRVPRAGVGRLQQPGSLPPGRAARRRALDGLDEVHATTEALRPVVVVGGTPLPVGHQLFNAAFAPAPRTGPRGGPQELPAEPPRVLREASLQRSPPGELRAPSTVLGPRVPFGADLLFAARGPSRTSSSRSRSARTSGSPCRPAPSRRWRARVRRGQPLGEQRHGREVGVSPAALLRALGPDLLGLRVRGHRRARASRRPIWRGTVTR